MWLCRYSSECEPTQCCLPESADRQKTVTLRCMNCSLVLTRKYTLNPSSHTNKSAPNPLVKAHAGDSTINYGLQTILSLNFLAESTTEWIMMNPEKQKLKQRETELPVFPGNVQLNWVKGKGQKMSEQSNWFCAVIDCCQSAHSSLHFPWQIPVNHVKLYQTTLF